MTDAETKRCTKCRREQPVDDFAPRAEAPHRRSSWCAECMAAARADWQRRNPAKRREYDRTSYHRNPTPKLRRGRAWRAALRAEVHAAYGGCCECCGEGAPEFLTLDHIGGRSGEHVGAPTYKVYMLVKREGFPRDRYRLLCWNCNMAHGVYGYCPHERAREAA